jgi:hypothetical protein
VHCRKKVEFLDYEPGGTYSYQCGLNHAPRE